MRIDRSCNGRESKRMNKNGKTDLPGGQERSKLLKNPWPMRYVLFAIVIFALIYNLFLLLDALGE